MVPLNPEAPEFYPTHNNTFKIQHQEQPFPLPNFPTSTFTPHSHYYYYYAVSSFPSRELHPYNYYYYPTTTLPPPSVPSYNGSIATPLEPPRVHGIERDFCPVDDHAVNQKKNDEVVVAEAVTCGAKGLVQKQVFKAFISCGTMNSHRSDGSRMKAYARRRKGEEKGQRKGFDFLKNGRVQTHPDEQCFKGYPKKKRCYPVLPVRVERNETTVMIKNIPSKYTYAIYNIPSYSLLFRIFFFYFDQFSKPQVLVYCNFCHCGYYYL